MVAGAAVEEQILAAALCGSFGTFVGMRCFSRTTPRERLSSALLRWPIQGFCCLCGINRDS